MPRLIDADALINETMERYCSDCERRKGVKNGKWKIVYSIGDAPCRACGIGDMIDELEDAPTIEERKKGKWIPHREICREYIGTVLANVDYAYWLCDTCGYRVKKRQPMHNFCPNCGADMRGEGNGNE